MNINKKIRCLIVEDEPPAQKILIKYIMQVNALSLSGTCSSAVEAISFLQQNSVDLIFLDIQMPGLLGTKFIRTLNNPPKVIFTTAYRKFALEGFELDAVDFLLKPIAFERFLKAVNKILQTNLQTAQTQVAGVENTAEAANPFLYFRAERKMVKVLLRDILYIEGLKDYVRIRTTTKTIVTKHLLSSLAEMLPVDFFLRIHRSYIVAVHRIDSYNADTVEIAKTGLPIGRLFKHNVGKCLNSSSAARVGSNPTSANQRKN
jgi:DNA-binding LytR/AlgR family response regulator